jgi:hypothetical protein
MADEADGAVHFRHGEVSVVRALDIVEKLGGAQGAVNEVATLGFLLERKAEEILRVGLGQAIAGPEDRFLGEHVERADVQFITCSKIMISSNNYICVLLDLMQALGRLGAVADDVPQADVRVYVFGVQGSQDSLQGVKISMDVRQNRVTQSPPSGTAGLLTVPQGKNRTHRAIAPRA